MKSREVKSGEVKGRGNNDSLKDRRGRVLINSWGRRISAALAACLLVASISGCGSGGTPAETIGQEPAASVVAESGSVGDSGMDMPGENGTAGTLMDAAGANSADAADSTGNAIGDKDAASEDGAENAGGDGSAAAADSDSESVAPANSAESAAETTQAEEQEAISYMFDASEMITTGKVKLDHSIEGYTGEGYLTGFENEGDGCSFTVDVPYSGSFDIHVVSAGLGGEKINDIQVDGTTVGTFTTKDETFGESVLRRVYLEAGEHSIGVHKNWGWIALDSMTFASAERLPDSTFEVEPVLINPNASQSAVNLMKYLTSIYGEYTLSGQQADNGTASPEMIAIKNATGGKQPAILGLDLMNYSPSFASHGAVGKSIEQAIEYDKLGGIVTFCWHWGAPEKYAKSGAAWYRTFYADSTDIDLAAIMDGSDEEGYALLLDDIDVIAEQLKILQDADVPVLFRPLHEASGGWFWWGAAGPEPCKELWKLLYDRLTNVHGLNNLIWVWNGQAADWYPGDEYVDIIGEDIYPGNYVYSSQSGKFAEAVEYPDHYPETAKIVALSENGCFFDPDLAWRDQAPWAWFCTWSGEFVAQNGYNKLSGKYTEDYMVEKVYNHERVITLDELPDWKSGEN